MLEVKGLMKRFGGIVAIDDVSFSTSAHEILGIIGPNGAGKSTLFNLATGTIRPTSGRISFAGLDITGKRPDQVASHGLIRTFQAATMFKGLTVKENLKSAHQFRTLSRPSLLLRRGRVRNFRGGLEALVEDVLDFTELSPYADRIAGELSYGQQKLLGLAMALAAEPRQLLMDEPAAGLNPSETSAMGALIERTRSERGIGVVLVEHDMKMVTGISDRMLVMNQGKVLATGTPKEIQANLDVVEAYLGAEIDLS